MPPKNDNLKNWISANMPGRPCACGCGEIVPPTRERYYRADAEWFVLTHQMRGVHHGLYKGGLVLSKGYWWILSPDHPRRTKRNYVKRCWLVIEKKLGRYLAPGELVHHRNGNKQDDRPSNLQVTDRVWHGRHHNSGKNNKSYRHDIDSSVITRLKQSGKTRDEIAELLKCGTATVTRRLRKERAL